jgi:hypothetical protein
MKRYVMLSLIMAVVFAASIAMAQTLPTPKELFAKAKAAKQEDSAVHKVEMTLMNKRGDKMLNQMVTRSKTVKGLSRTVTTFLLPDETKGTKFLMLQNTSGPDTMMIFIPDLKRVRTISTSQSREQYMGTDFAYSDLEDLDVAVGEHKVEGIEPVDGQDCYKVVSLFDPKTGGGYSKQVNWFRKDCTIAVKTEYYDKDGKLKKIRMVSDLYQQGKVWIMKKVTMQDVQKDHRTIIEIKQADQKPVEDSFFTEQFLLQTDKY